MILPAFFSRAWFSVITAIATLLAMAYVLSVGVDIHRVIASAGQIDVPKVLRGSWLAPQVFPLAADASEATKIREVLDDLKLIPAAKRFFAWDNFALVPGYTLTFISLSAFVRRRLRANGAELQPWSRRAAHAIPWFALLAALADFAENFACLRCLAGQFDWLGTARLAFFMKWPAAGLAALTLGVAGIGVLTTKPNR